MFAPTLDFESAEQLSRFDSAHPLSSCGREIQLDGSRWASAEHYVHTQLAGNEALAEKARTAATGLDAYTLNKPWYRAKKKGWRKLRRVYMSRALYTQVQMYDDVREYLLATQEQIIAETSQYDHYWGIGRDLRGENMFGVIWMDIRKKLITDAKD